MATRETNATPTAAPSSRLTPRKNSPVAVFLEAGGVLVDDVPEDQRIEQREDLVDGGQHQGQRHQTPVLAQIGEQQFHDGPVSILFALELTPGQLEGLPGVLA